MNDTDQDREADYEEGGVLDRIKESPRTISALIIILIVAAAIYAFSGNNANQVNEEGTPLAVTTPEASTSPAPTTTPNQTPTSTPAQSAAPVATQAPVTQEQLQDASKNLPEPRKTDSAYVEVAQAGEGVTHLSRRATTRYLAENKTDYTITNAHRIYIEDYIQNRIGTTGLSIGQEQSISFDMVKEAVEAAKSLNDQQLQNLSQYTYVLT